MEIIAVTTNKAEISKILGTENYRLVINHPSGKYYAKFSTKTGFESKCVCLISQK